MNLRGAAIIAHQNPQPFQIPTFAIMKKQVLPILICILLASCGQKTPEQAATPISATTTTNHSKPDNPSPTSAQKPNPTNFLPKGYIVFERIYGDLNKDGIADSVLIIKGTDKSKIVTDDYRGELDRNRRGIMVLLSKNGQFELAVENYDCFSSENEDGGVYYAPDLSVVIQKGNLYIEYAHGRYGYWKYTFRFQNGDFELIGYDSSNNYGPVVNSETSINFSTKVKIVNVNTNGDAESGEEVFETTQSDVSIAKLIKLSEIKDFDELDMGVY